MACRPGQQQQQLHEQQRTFDSTWWTRTQQATMASKSPNRHWKTANWKASGQLKTLEKEQADLLKSFSRHLNELEGYLTQNKTMTAESAYRCFFETYDNLEDNRQQQRLLLKPKYVESFDNDTKPILEEKGKVLRWVVDKIPDLQDIEDCRAVVVDYRKDTLRWYNILEDSVTIENELVELEKKLKSENLSDCEKQILCDQAERLLEKRDEICAEAIRILKTESCPMSLRISVKLGVTIRIRSNSTGSARIVETKHR